MNFMIVSLKGFEPSGYSISITETPLSSNSTSLYICSLSLIIVETLLYLKYGKKNRGRSSEVEGELIAMILFGIIQDMSPWSNLLSLKYSAVSNFV